MKQKIYSLIAVLLISLTACRKLDVPPVNVIQDKDLFTTEAGITAYLARIYITMPVEDFKYTPTGGFNNTTVGSAHAVTGEASSRDMGNTTETFNYWSAAYTLIRDCNYFMETLPTYAGNFKPEQVTNWMAEARFIRAFTYFALVKRYGGVPIVDKLLTSPGQTISELASEIEELKIPRASEEAVYDFISADCDLAFVSLPETNKTGRANKYAAAALKSRAMLFAGTIAKYNTINLTSTDGKRLCGIPASKAATYFKASYDAANLLTGKYNLYKAKWAAGDKTAQYNNFVNLFLDATAANNEAIFVRQYKYPDAVHQYDATSVPKQLEGPQGNYSSETCPTLNFVEMFEGFPKNADGTIQVLDATGKYIFFNNTTDLFANAEPRLRATVILPGDQFKGTAIEVRRGIYTGSSAAGLNKLLPANSTSAYPATVVGSATIAENNTNLYTLPNGSKVTKSGLSGVFTAITANATGGTITGFYIRKYLNPDKATAETIPGRSEQQWMEFRYGEVLLNKAEAAYELFLLGQAGTYGADALTAINQVRERAGASLLTAITSANDIRMERRRELAFENKTIWDLRRWRIADQEQNATIYKALLPILVADQNKYIMDARFEERSVQFTFQSRWYYTQIPTAAIAKSLNLVQNPGW